MSSVNSFAGMFASPPSWLVALTPFGSSCALRYKYLQKPLETSSLPTLMQYIHRWTPPQTEKLSTAVGLLISQGLAGASCLLSLTKDHLVKNGAQTLSRISQHLTHPLLVRRCIPHRHHFRFPGLLNRSTYGSSLCHT